MTRTFAPWVVLGIFVLYLAASALDLPARSAADGFDVAAFGRLPVSVGGRVQPLDSVARTALLQLRGPVTPLDRMKAPQARPAMIDPTTWLLEVLARPDVADTRRVFAIADRELLGRLHLQAASRGTSYFAFDELGPKASEIQDQVQHLANVKAPDRARWQRELVALRDHLMLYERLKNSLVPNSRLQRDAQGKPVTFDFAGELVRYQADLAEALRVDAGRRRGSAERLDVGAEMRIRAFAALFQIVSRTGVLALVPAPRTAGSSDRWSNLGSVVVQSALGKQPPQPVAFLAGMSSAFAQGKPDSFNAQLEGYRRWLAASGLAAERRRVAAEAISNAALPLVRAVVLYALALVLAVLALGTGSAAARRSALLLVVLASAMHAAGLVLAAVLAGRPSSLAVTGWALALAAIAVGRLRRSRLGTLASAAVGAASLVAAYAVAPGGVASLLRNAVDAGLLVAIAATVLALSVGRERRTERRPATAPRAALESPAA